MVKGILYPTVESTDIDGEPNVYSLPPRYRGREEAVQVQLGIDDIRENVLIGGFKGFFRWVKSLFITPRPMPKT